jgi:hypothetical protein
MRFFVRDDGQRRTFGRDDLIRLFDRGDIGAEALVAQCPGRTWKALHTFLPLLRPPLSSNDADHFQASAPALDDLAKSLRFTDAVNLEISTRRPPGGVDPKYLKHAAARIPASVSAEDAAAMFVRWLYREPFQAYDSLLLEMLEGATD